MILNIEEMHAGLTIEAYLKGLHFSRHQISRLKFRRNGIVLNGKQARVSEIIHEGDELELNLYDDKAEPTSGSMRQIDLDYENDRITREEPEKNTNEIPAILYEDDCILVVNKPNGIVCHPAHGHFGDTIMDIVDKYLCGKENLELKQDLAIRTKPYLIGRLDKDTSGVLLFAKNQETATLLAAQRERGLLQKTYLALCQGVFVDKKGVINEPIAKVPGELNRMMISQDGKAAETYYWVRGLHLLEKSQKDTELMGNVFWHSMMKADSQNEVASIREKRATLVEVKIRHGRTHQIRLHMSSIGHPLVGDPIYGGYTDDQLQFLAEHGRNFAHLHAWNLEFRQPFTGERIEVEAPIPECMQNI